MAKRRKFRKLSTLAKYINNKDTSLLESAWAIGDLFLPKDVTLRASIFRIDAEYNTETRVVQWYVGNGLPMLLHEIGHAVLIPKGYSGKELPIIIFVNEIEAWIYSEIACKALGIKFDYDLAEKLIGTYRKYYKLRDAIAPKWRHKDENNG